MSNEQKHLREYAPLAPCPFCGNTGSDLVIGDEVGVYVMCEECLAVGPWLEEDVHEAVNQWNSRSLKAMKGFIAGSN
jgi:Lar family restriction alleviation protein